MWTPIEELLFYIVTPLGVLTLLITVVFGAALGTDSVRPAPDAPRRWCPADTTTLLVGVAVVLAVGALVLGLPT